MNALPPSPPPRPRRPVLAAATVVAIGATLFAALVATGCATTPSAGEPGAGAAAPVPEVPAPIEQPTAEQPATPPADSEAPGAAAEKPAAAPTATAPEAATGGPSPVVEAPQRYGKEGRYFPEVPSHVLFAGLRRVEGAAPLTLRIEQDARAESGGVEFTQAITDGERSFVEHFVARIDDDGLSVGLASEQLRAVPPPAREIPRRPRVGETWSVSLGGSTAHCLIEELESAVTFDGKIDDCVRVRIDHPSGAVHRRWYHPERGLVRAEARDHDGRLLSGWAVTVDAWPAMERVQRLFAN